MTEIALYDRMCSAIAECHRVDEVKDIRDKAMALEAYARQAKNTDAERRACDIRMRAERRTGELLKELARATPQTANSAGVNGKQVMSNDATRPPATQPSPYAETLSRTGISRQTAHRYQALASVPSETFEAAMREPAKPTTSGILARAEAQKAVQQARDPAPQMPADSLWIWGRLRDLERDGYFSKTPSSLLDPMTETMRADVLRILPMALDFFNALHEATHEPA